MGAVLSHDELLKNAKECFDKGNYKQASLLFNEIIESDSKCFDAIFYMANIFHMKGEIGKAIKAFKKVLEINPDHTDASIGLSVIYNDIGKYDEAKRIFDQADRRVKTNTTNTYQTSSDSYINKKFSLKHFELAELYFTYGRYDEALFEYNKSTILDPENLEGRIKVAKVYAKKGLISKSCDELKKLKNEYPRYMPARVALGVLYYGNGNILEARSEWERVQVLDPQNSEAATYLNLSQAATETKI